MKKSKLYTVTKGNRPAFMPGIDDNVYSIGGFVDKITDNMGNWLGGDKLMSDGKPTVAGGLLGAAGNIVGSGLNSAVSGGLSSGVGEGISSIGSTIGGALSTVNPILGGIVSAGSGLLGGITNALFGAKFNDENIADVEGNIAKMRSQNLNSVNTNAALLDAWGKVNLGYDFNKNYIGRDGLFSNKVKKKFNNLNAFQNAARAYVKHQLLTGAEQADQTQDDLAMSTFTYANGGPLIPYTGALGLMQNDAYINAINNRSDAIMGKKNILGNPQNYFGDGGGIHIAPSKKGTFTAAATKHGMGVQEFARKVLANKDDYSPAMVKKANFARNASKWHAFGGELGTNGTDFTNGLMFIDAGGTHQQNPLGGVPVGFDQNGTPNLVEEGETIWNDYVFSNRIKVPKAMFHTLGLGGAMKKGITFADASKKLAKESEQRPNDPISLDGLNISLAKLAAVQEAERMKKQMRQSVGLENMAAYGGPVNRFDDGGEKTIAKLRELYSKLLGVDSRGKEERFNIDKAIYKDVMGADWEKESAVTKEEFYENIDDYMGMLYNDLLNAYDKNPSQFVAKSIPEDRKKFRGNIADWLRQNYWDLSEDEVQNITEQVFTEAEQKRRQEAIVSKYGEPKTKTDSIFQQMMLENPGTIGRFYSPAFSEFINKPVFNTSEANVKDYIRKAMQRGLDFEEAYSLMGGSRVGSNDREKYQAKQRMKEELESEFKNSNSSNKDSSVQQNTNNDLETQQPEQLEEQAAPSANPDTEWGIQNAMQEATRRGVSAGIAPSIGSDYAGTSGVRGNGNAGVIRNRNNGLTKDMAFVSSLDDMFNGTYGFTPSNGAQYIPYTGMSEAEVREIENDPRFQSWTNRVNDNFYNEKDVEVQNYLRQLDKAAGGNHLFDADGKLRSDAKDYYNRARTQNHLMGWYHLTPLFEKASQAANTQASGYVIGDDGKLVSKEDYLNVDRATSPGWVSPEVPDRIESPQRENPVNEKRPLLPTQMRYAPVFGNALAVLSDLFNKPDYTYPNKLEAAAYAAGQAPTVNYQPIGDYIRYSPFDIWAAQNRLDANNRATQRAMLNQASPSRDAGLAALAYAENIGAGQLQRQSAESNLAQKQQVADFNIRPNMFNSQMGLEAAMANARYGTQAKAQQMQGLAQVASLRDAIDRQYSAARSANLTNLFNSLGNIGKENFIFNQINSDKSRSYYVDPVTGEGYYVMRPKEKKSCGGKMNKK